MAYSNRSTNILNKENSLGLNHKEVDELVDVTNHTIEGSSRNGPVSAGAHLSSETVVENNLTRNLGRDSDGKSHEGQLESPSNHIEVPSGEDERDNRSVGNGGGT